jgi:hypothetical protein
MGQTVGDIVGLEVRRHVGLRVDQAKRLKPVPI